MAENIKNKNVKLRISDPWDLGEQIGWKELGANVIGVKDDGYVPIALALKLDIPFDYKNNYCEYFIASPRLEGDDFSKLALGQAVYCGLTRVPFNQISGGDLFDLGCWRGGVGLIGEIEL